MAYDDNIQALLSAASIVRDETHEGGNTAARVGQLLVDMITSFDSAYKALSDSIPEGVDLSILKSYLSKEEAETLFDTQSVFNRLFVEDTTNDAIKALKHLYSVSDISAFGYVKTELPSSGVTRFADLLDVPKATSGKTQYWGWEDDAYKWLDAPEGGGTTNFAALTLVINGLNEQYFPTGDSKIFDLDAVYAKKGEGGNVNLDDYYTKTDINTLLKGYAKTSDIPTDYVTNGTLATTVKNVKAYTDNAIDNLNISQYATNSALNTAINGANVTAQDYATQAYNNAVDYADGKFVTKATDYEEITGIKMLTGAYMYIGNNGLLIDNNNTDGVYLGGHTAFRGDRNYLNFLKDGNVYVYNSLKIGNAYLTYDSDNNALFVKGKDGAPINLVATGDVAAYSGLGSGFDTLTDLALTNKLTVKDIQASNKITAKNIDAQYLSVSNSMQQSIDMGGYDIDNCQTCTCQYMFINEINLGSDQITELSVSGSYMYLRINGTRYKISVTKA